MLALGVRLAHDLLGARSPGRSLDTAGRPSPGWPRRCGPGYLQRRARQPGTIGVLSGAAGARAGSTALLSVPGAAAAPGIRRIESGGTSVSVEARCEDVIKSYKASDPENPVIFRRSGIADAEPAVPGGAWRWMSVWVERQRRMLLSTSTLRSKGVSAYRDRRQ